MQPSSGLRTILFVSAVQSIAGNILVDRRKETSIECASNTELTFKFFSNTLNKSLTIAECDFMMKSCRMLATTSENKYKISYTGRGGIMSITSLDAETIGTYQCYETYNPINFVSTNITLSQYTVTAGNYRDEVHPELININVPAEISGHIVLGTLKETSVECASNVEIVFKFISNKSNKSVTIAECDPMMNSCNMFNNTLQNKYILSYTGRGGNLRITSLDDETYGTYKCCETYNPSNFVSIDIIAHYMDASDNATYVVIAVTKNNTANHSDESGTNNTSNMLNILLPILAALVIIVICVIVIIKKKVCCSSKQTHEVERESEEKAELMKKNVPQSGQNEECEETKPSVETELEQNAELVEVNGQQRGQKNECRETKPSHLHNVHTMSRSKTCLVVAAFDFGTSYSGYAYSNKNDPANVVMNNNWYNSDQPSDLISLRTPTSVLLDDKGQFHSFGFEAEEYFVSLAKENKHRGWRLFRRFKMILNNNKNLSRYTTIDDIEGNPYSAMEIFTMAIQFLHGHLLAALKRTLPSLHETEIQYIITVPAIWDAGAKQFMREAAVQAGIDGERLELAFESVVAAVWCTLKAVEAAIWCSWLYVRDGPTIDILSKCLLIDLGGGTADITAFLGLPNGNVKVIHQSSGGAWGGTYVDQQFFDYLDNVLGAGLLDELRRDHIEYYLELFRYFEEEKRSKTVFQSRPFFDRLQPSLRPKGWKNLVTRDKTDKHRIDSAEMKKWFEKPIVCLIECIRDLLENDSIKGVSTMLLVGGFAESVYVQNRLKEEFTRINLIVPPDAGLVVLKGALVFGHNPGIVLYT